MTLESSIQQVFKEKTWKTEWNRACIDTGVYVYDGEDEVVAMTKDCYVIGDMLVRYDNRCKCHTESLTVVVGVIRTRYDN